MMKVMAGIVTFQPDIHRLHENIENIINQVDALIIVDNASGNKNEILQILTNTERANMIQNHTNKGIATALNQIMAYAKDNGYDWVLTLDQDSVCKEGLIEKYREYINVEKVGIMTCLIKDRNYDFNNGEISDNAFIDVNYCITSGSFMNVDVFYKVGKFDEQMFIDKVDFDICLSFLEAGYRIIKINYSGILHQVGDAEQFSFMGIDIVAYNHSALRRYYMTRNGIYLGRKHPSKSLARSVIRELYDMLIVFIFEDEKWNKLKSSFKGIWDAIRLPINHTEAEDRDSGENSGKHAV